MSEAIIIYRGRGSSVDPEKLKPTTISTNGIYEAPVTGNYLVYAVGGGGGGGGGCRNSWNSSQVFYGAAGTRGTLNSKTVFLNQGDKVQCNLGAGGTGGTNNTTVVSNNSRGTNGSAGGTTSFGSYVSGTGGTYGAYSWSWHGWSNTYTWNNRITSWNNQPIAGTGVWTSYTGYIQGNAWVLHRTSRSSSNEDRKTYFYSLYPSWTYSNPSYNPSGELQGYSMDSKYEVYQYDYWFMFCADNQSAYYNSYSKLLNNYSQYGWADQVGPYQATRFNLWCTFSGYVNNITGWNNQPVWTNTLAWNNRIVNTSTRCYTSIQTGSWWYLNNNAVTTSGSRIYRGDGGNSGVAGNAGYLLIIPPTT